jgi:hypothetical protein
MSVQVLKQRDTIFPYIFNGKLEEELSPTPTSLSARLICNEASAHYSTSHRDTLHTIALAQL